MQAGERKDSGQRSGTRLVRDQGCQRELRSGLTLAATGVDTFMLGGKAVGVAVAATEPEGRACSCSRVKEPHLDKVPAPSTRISLQLTPGCKQNIDS